MQDNVKKLSIPYDMYESPDEIFVIVPLWGVDKSSLRLTIQDYQLHIAGVRNKIVIKESLSPIKEQCYWWAIQQSIDLPNHVYFDKIHSKLTPDNILQIIIPKVVIPEHIDVLVE